MVLSKRERYVVIGAAVVLAALALDQFLLTPLLQGAWQAQTRRQVLQTQMDRAQVTMKQNERLAPRWSAMVAAGIQNDPAGAESQILHSIRDWSEESGVSLSLLRPDRLTEKSRLPQVAFQASGTGSLDSVARLLWRIQNAKIPVRITDLQVAARKEGVDDLAFQLRVSTIYQSTQRSASQPAPGGRGKGGGQ